MTIPNTQMRQQSNSLRTTEIVRSHAALRLQRARAAHVLLVALLAASCGKSEEVDDAKSVSAAPVSSQLPPITLTDDTPDLLLTWVDERGDFHVCLKPSEVPEGARETVRVVLTTQEEGTGKMVYVADLKTKLGDGSYKVSTITRSQWDEIGADRRKVRLEALAPSAKPAATGPAGTKVAAGKVTAVVYGADWCNPCHQAEKLLKSLGADVTKKDIEKSPAARAEMQQLLAKAGRVGASIPVIDVAGQLLVGFSAQALRQAVKQARKPETL